MSLIGHFLFVLILSLVLEAHKSNQGWGKGQELWGLGERARQGGPSLQVFRLRPRALGRVEGLMLQGTE